MTKTFKRLTTDRTTSNSSMQQVYSNWDSMGMWRGTDYWSIGKKPQRPPAIPEHKEQSSTKPQYEEQVKQPQRKPIKQQYDESPIKQQYYDTQYNEPPIKQPQRKPIKPSFIKPQYDDQQYYEQPVKQPQTKPIKQQYEEPQYYNQQDEEEQDNNNYDEQQYYEQQDEEEPEDNDYEDINKTLIYNDYEEPQYNEPPVKQHIKPPQRKPIKPSFIKPQYDEQQDEEEPDNNNFEDINKTLMYNNYEDDNYKQGIEDQNYLTQYEEPITSTQQDNSLLQPQYNNYIDEDSKYYINNQQFDEEGNLIQQTEPSQYDYKYDSHSINPNIANSELDKSIENQISELQQNISSQYDNDENNGYYVNNYQHEEVNESLQNDINNAMQQYQEQKQISTELDNDIKEEEAALTKEQQNIKNNIDNIIKQYEDNTESQYSVIDKINNSKYNFNDYEEDVNEENKEINNILNSGKSQYDTTPIIQEDVQFKELGNDYSQDYNQYESPETDNLINENNINTNDLLQYNNPIEYSETFKPYSGMRRERFDDDITCVCDKTKNIKKKELDMKVATYSILGIIVFIIIFSLCIFWYKNKLLSTQQTKLQDSLAIKEFLMKNEE